VDAVNLTLNIGQGSGLTAAFFFSHSFMCQESSICFGNMASRRCLTGLQDVAAQNSGKHCLLMIQRKFGNATKVGAVARGAE